MDPNWTRWIAASIYEHFRVALATASLPMYVEGQSRRTDHQEDYVEVRYTGPRFEELSSGYWQVDVDIDVLVCSKLNNRDIYTPEDDLGVVLAGFTKDIGVFKLGKREVDDPDVQIGCLVLDPDYGCVTVNNFGLVRDQVRIRQASVDATYRMNIST